MSEDFLRRWSRLKRGSATPSAAPSPDPAPALPPLESLTFESDFKAFMHSKVEEGVKRAALKKLFADPRFNVMDGLDTYIDDYTKAEPITEELLAQIEHARRALVLPEPEEAPQAPAAEAVQENKDADPGQDA
jgi:hypothetical protein